MKTPRQGVEMLECNVGPLLVAHDYAYFAAAITGGAGVAALSLRCRCRPGPCPAGSHPAGAVEPRLTIEIEPSFCVVHPVGTRRLGKASMDSASPGTLTASSAAARRLGRRLAGGGGGSGITFINFISGRRAGVWTCGDKCA